MEAAVQSDPSYDGTEFQVSIPANQTDIVTPFRVHMVDIPYRGPHDCCALMSTPCVIPMP